MNVMAVPIRLSPAPHPTRPLSRRVTMVTLVTLLSTLQVGEEVWPPAYGRPTGGDREERHHRHQRHARSMQPAPLASLPSLVAITCSIRRNSAGVGRDSSTRQKILVAALIANEARQTALDKLFEASRHVFLWT